MFKYAFIPSRSLLLPFLIFVAFALPAAAAPATGATDVRVSESYGRLPLHFEANQGQTHKDVRFIARGPGYSLYLTSGEAVLVLTKPNPDAKRDARSLSERRDAQPPAKPAVVRMSLVGAARKPLVSGLDPLPGKANYFIGKHPAKWRTNVPTYAKVHYRGIYPGIDLVYFGNQRQLEYDFVVAPGADPKRIVLNFKGTDKLEIDAQGELVLHAAGDTIRQRKPLIYQEIDGVRREIDGGYVLKSARRVGFQLAAYDRTRPLVVDPVVLLYSTYLGGSGDDVGNSIAVDANGSAYVTGSTYSPNFPTAAGAFQTGFAGGNCFDYLCADAFVAKLNPTGTALVYSTYLGGSSSEEGNGIAVDADGNAYVTGDMGCSTSSNFPTTPGAFQPTGIGCGFVTKLDPTGSALVYSTLLYGRGFGIAVDADRNAYVTGWTSGPSFFSNSSFPTTAGAFQTSPGGSTDAFVTKFNPTGSALVYSTYLGGTRGDGGYGIAVDAGGNAYVTGATQSSNFPITTGAFQASFVGQGNCGFDVCPDAFVTKLNSSGSALVYSTFLGGSGGDGGHSIAVDAAGNAYVTGGTASANFPTTAGAFHPSTGGLEDAFVTKLDPTGSVLVYSTYLGGSGVDRGVGIALDAAGNAHVTGLTTSNDFPTTAGAFQPTFGGIGDAFMTKLNPVGSGLVYSTYLGGSQRESGNGIAVDTAGNAYATGATQSPDFPTTPGAFQPSFGGGDPNSLNPNTFARDAFVAKIVDVVLQPLATAALSAQLATTRSEESAATDIGSWVTYGSEVGTFSGGTIVASNVAADATMFSFTGTAVSWIGVKCNVCGIATVSLDGGAPTTVDTASPGVPGSLTSEVVFSASGLAAGVSHTMVITVTGTTASDNAYIAVDAFDVTR